MLEPHFRCQHCGVFVEGSKAAIVRVQVQTQIDTKGVEKDVGPFGYCHNCAKTLMTTLVGVMTLPLHRNKEDGDDS